MDKKKKKIKRKKIKNIIVGISGASGVKYAIDFCTVLQLVGYNPIVIITKSAEKVAELESGILISSILRRLKIEHYSQEDIGVSVASGSFETEGMVVYPCSISTLSKIAYSMNTNLLIRAADVHIKERRKLILVVRETPFHAGHIDLMRRACKNGAIIAPLIFSFYSKKGNDKKVSVEDLFSQFNGRILDFLGIKNDMVQRWKG